MKKLLLIILFISVLASICYLIFINNLKQLNPSKDSESITEIFGLTKISKLSFSYKTTPNGYVLINNQVNWPENIISSISLLSKHDYKGVSQPGFVGEGPPSMTISVFKNPERLDAQAWADANSPASNIELIDSPPVPAEVGGIDGIYYLVLGLYLFDTYVISYNDEIYLLSGAYYEKNDEYYQNFSDVVSTVVIE